MNITPRKRAALLALATSTLAACGGSDTPTMDNSGPTTFQAQMLARQAPESQSAAVAAPIGADLAQVGAGMTREWAVPELGRSSVFTNAAVAPPVHFAYLQSVAAAARGQTQARLDAVLPAAPVRAALMQGVSRTVRAGAQTAVSDDFMAAVAMADHPTTLKSLTLAELPAATLQQEPHLRVEVTNTFDGRHAWQRPVAFQGHFITTNLEHLTVPMLRVAGAVLMRTGADHEAAGLALADGRWLWRLTPVAGIAPWPQAALASALAELGAVMALGAAAQAQPGDMVVPAAAAFAVDALNGGPDLWPATDPVTADMRGLDGIGGTYLRAPAGSGMLRFDSLGFDWSASRTAQFVWDPRNVFNGSFGSASTLITPGNVFGTGTPTPQCTSPAADLRPAYYVWLDASGRVLLLARLATLEGTRCLP